MTVIASRAATSTAKPSPGRAIAALAGLRMLTVKRAATRSADAPWVWIGTLCGLVAAASTIAVAIIRPDLLSLLLAGWAAGSILAPLVKGGSGTPVAGEFLALSGMTARRMSLVVTVTALVGLGPALVLLAGLSQLVLARGPSPFTVMTALFAVLLWTALVVALGRVAGELSRRLMGATTGAVASGVMTAFLFALAAQGWVFVVAFFHTPSLWALARAALNLPSGWGIVAIRAADEGRWGDAVGLLALLLLSVCVLFWAAAVIAVPPARPGRRSRRVSTRHELRARSLGSAVVGKAVRSILRDPFCVNRIAFALAYGLFFTTMPLVLGWHALVPFTGPIAIVMAAAMLGNPYGLEGTALWLIVTTPGAARLDVRARQVTFAVIIGAGALTQTVLLSLTTPEYPWPLALALLASSLGAATGWSTLIGVLAPAPMTDPHKRSSWSESGASATGSIFLILGAASVTSAPGFLALWIGWWALPAGITAGILSAWILGRLAWKRLDARGSELLATLSGTTPSSRRQTRPAPNQPAALSPWQRAFVLNALWIAPILIVQQGVVPALLRNRGSTWLFLALYLPAPWSWLVIAVCISLGLTMAGGAVWLLRQSKRARLQLRANRIADGDIAPALSPIPPQYAEQTPRPQHPGTHNSRRKYGDRLPQWQALLRRDPRK